MKQLEIKEIQDAITRIFEKKNVNGDFVILDHAVLELKKLREENKILNKTLDNACELLTLLLPTNDIEVIKNHLLKESDKENLF